MGGGWMGTRNKPTLLVPDASLIDIRGLQAKIRVRFLSVMADEIKRLELIISIETMKG